MKYLNDKDVATGLMFILIGLVALFLMQGFEFGSTARPGPGFFPIVLSVLLMLIGAVVAGRGLLHQTRPVIRFAMRPFVLITCAVCVFAVCIEPLGLVLAVMLAATTASFARPQYGAVHRVLVSIGLAGFSALLFVAALNLPIALWPV